ncbi:MULTISPECIES: PEPxxWA-CTERM sorting domain-containing protein [unclassified Phenylobacterium]|uniref:PEPxxWA-CTERM sorting domain-containing protein n=1 Tax=unclassified Phenylobacterium TaxID=2640670 RepID=UPI00083AB710|nr:MULTISPECIES: PEPxxWA-CTERM sorting domain-containing protein [unclassified Phenylobacterium]
MRRLAIAVLAVLGAACSGSAYALTPISGQAQVQSHTFINGFGLSDTDTDAKAWSGVPANQLAFATSQSSVLTDDLFAGALATGSVYGTWAADGSSGSVETLFAWSFTNIDDVGLIGASFNGLNPNWSYTFQADRDGVLIWQGQLRVDPSVPSTSTFGLTGWDLLMDGVTIIDLTDPSAPLPRTGDGDFALVGGQTYTLSLTNFSNIAGLQFGSNYRGRVLGEFYWEIQEEPAIVPEPGAWALLLLGFALAGGSLRARRRACA